MSFIYRENKKRPKIVHWGTPDQTGAHSDFSPFTTTRCRLEHRKYYIHFNVLPPFPQLNILLLMNSRGSVSNAFPKLNVNVSTRPLFSKILTETFITLVNWVSHLSPFPHARCLPGKSLYSSRWSMIFEHTMCSSRLQGTQVKETGRKLRASDLSPFLKRWEISDNLLLEKMGKKNWT